MDKQQETYIEQRERITELETAIKKHYFESVGQNQCWVNDEELWKVLNDRIERKYPHSLNPDPFEFMKECINYCKSRQKVK
jgi:hypothetical protein